MNQELGKIFIPYEALKDILTYNLVYQIISNGSSQFRNIENQGHIGLVDTLVIKEGEKDYYDYLFPKDYFCFFDAPLAQLLKILKEDQAGEQNILRQQGSNKEDKLFRDMLRYYSDSAFPRNKFGVTFVENKREISIKIPNFCKKARIEAFDRYVACRNKARNLNTFTYQTSKLENAIPLNYIEESWFYEMCSGVSFVSEIVAALIQLEDIHRGDISQANSWEKYRIPILIQLLNEYHLLSEFPALYWRSAVIRRIFFEIDEKCWEQESQHKRLDMVYYEKKLNRLPEGSPIDTSEAKNWYLYAKYWFIGLLAEETTQIGITTAEYQKLWLLKILQPSIASNNVWGDISEKMIPKELNLEKYFSYPDPYPLFNKENIRDTPEGWEKRQKEITNSLKHIAITGNPLDWPTPQIPYQHYCNTRRLSKESIVAGKEHVRDQQLYDLPLTRQDTSHNRVIELFQKVHHALYAEGYLDFQA